MNSLNCGMFPGCYPWMPHFGVLFFIPGIRNLQRKTLKESKFKISLLTFLQILWIGREIGLFINYNFTWHISNPCNYKNSSCQRWGCKSDGCCTSASFSDNPCLVSQLLPIWSWSVSNSWNWILWTNTNVFLCVILFSGLHLIVGMAMGIAQVLLWVVWSGLTSHPSRLKLWMVMFGGALAKLLEIYEFPPYYGYVDSHALSHALTIPLTFLWWSFIKDDAKIQTSTLTKKTS